MAFSLKRIARSVAKPVMKVATLPVRVSARVTNSLAAKVLPRPLAASVRNVNSILLVPANALVRGAMPSRAEALQVGRGILTVAAVATGVAAATGGITATGGAATTSSAAATGGASSTVSGLAAQVGGGITTASKVVGTAVAGKSLISGAPQAAPPAPVYEPAPEPSGLNTGLLLGAGVLAIKLLL